MATNHIQYEKELDKVVQDIKDQIADVEKELVENIFEILTGSPPYGTPVKTGWASAGWRVSLNSPTPGAVGKMGNVSVSKSQGEKSLDRFLSMKDLSKISHIFIDNRVPYIIDLNNGTSQQAPEDFVDMAVQMGRALLTRKRIR